MEFLVTMTTRVPEGTPNQAVEDIRTREAARAKELAADGHLLRLWRPPLQPGEWRTLGLFVADDAGALEEALASMPLRVWRTDDVMPLSAHPNDPGPRSSAARAGNGTSEFLTTFTITVPRGTPDRLVEDTSASEARRAHDLATQGHLIRLWTIRGQILGLWHASGRPEMDRILASLPLAGWMTIDIVPLTRHPSDPG
jgi:muconolactone delta-isomerase